MPLLNDIIETLPQHHYFRDDIIFIIDTDLRTILSYKRGNMFVDNGSGLVSFLQVIGAQGDHNVNRITFKMLRYYNGIDLSLFVIKINYTTDDGKTGFYVINDLLIGDDYMLFTWLVSSNVTVNSGKVSFVVKMVQQQSPDIYNVFSTAISKGVVVPSIMMDNEIEELYRNVSERLNIFVGTTPPVFQDIRPLSIWIQMAATQDAIQIIDETDITREYDNDIIILTKDGRVTTNVYSGNGLYINCYVNQILYCTREFVQIIPYAVYVDGVWVSENITVGVRIKNQALNLDVLSPEENIKFISEETVYGSRIENDQRDIYETLSINAEHEYEVSYANMTINIQT